MVTSYTVTFNGNGSTSGTMANETNSAPTALSTNTFTRSGYSFTAWNTAANGTGTAYADGAVFPFSASATLYAQWSAVVTSYTVTFNGNGSTSGTMANETNSAPTALSTNTFTRSGYSFTGWNTAANGTGTAYADGAVFPFSASATLYAQWSAVVTSYTVTFNGNGSTSGTMANETNSAPTALSTNTFTRSGYSFTGWNTAANGTGTAYADGAVFPFSASATLYAQWSAVVTSYTVTFNGNGSTSGTMANETNSAPTALSTNTFTRSGYSFTGWNTAANGTGTAYADGAVFPFSASATLYAQWSAVVTSYTVTFNGNGSTSGTMANETNSAPTALSTNTFTRSGYSFTGWNTAANGTGTAYADGAVFPFSASATLYAQWSAVVTSYTVTFNGNGSTSGTMANETNSAPTALSTNTFTRSGYSFTGWNTAANGTGTAYADGAVFPFSASATLYAQWSAVVTSYTVTFNGNGSTSGTMANETNSAPTALSTNTFTTIGLQLHRAGTPPPTAPARPTPTARSSPSAPAPPSTPSGARW